MPSHHGASPSPFDTPPLAATQGEERGVGGFQWTHTWVFQQPRQGGQKRCPREDFFNSPSSTGIDSSVTPVARRDAKCGELRYFAGLACRYHGKAEDSSRIHVPRPSERDRHAAPVFEASSRSIPPPLRRNVQPPANHFVTGRRLHSSPISRPSSRRQSFEAGLRLPFGVGTPYMLSPVRSHSSRTAASCPASV